MSKSRVFALALVAVAVLFGLVQLVPYGHDHNNPPVQQEPAWASPQTRELAARACFDCHSNETRWPWYSSVAPVSWLVQRDVDEGRRRLNFSEWQGFIQGEEGRRGGLNELTEITQEGEMPPAIYLLMHADAHLSASEEQQLIAGFQATFK